MPIPCWNLGFRSRKTGVTHVDPTDGTGFVDDEAVTLAQILADGNARLLGEPRGVELEPAGGAAATDELKRYDRTCTRTVSAAGRIENRKVS